jgi:hypothetical protein
LYQYNANWGRYSNPYGSMGFSYGGQPPIPAPKSKPLRSILNTPWYIKNHRIHEDLKMNTALSEIKSGIPIA